jgi:uncharacterized protein
MTSAATQRLRDIQVIDVDTHLTEPHDLWTSRAPQKYRDRVPRVELVKNPDFGYGIRKATDTTPMWVVDKDTILGFAGGASVINRNDEKVKGAGFVEWQLKDVTLAASQVKPRLGIMDKLGIWAQIVYPNAVGFGGQRFMNIEDPELRSLCATLWNDAMADMQEESGGRINGMALLPWWDVDLAVSEIQRVSELGLRGVNTNADPQNQGMPDLSDPYFQPMWEACAALELPVNFHIGASVSQSSYAGTSPWPSLDVDTALALGSTMLYLGNARILSNLIYSGLLDRNPQLQVVSVESGIGWIPFVLEALDYQAVENNVDHLSLKPSEYFKRQMHACFWFEREGLLDAVQRVGVDNCMFETDFPHPTCLYPDPLTDIDAALKTADAEVRFKLLSGNAARLYKIPLGTTVG